MGRARHTADAVRTQDVFRDLVPLNSLSEEHFREISKHLVVQDVSAGRYLFSAGDQDNRSVYLLDGEVNFVDASGRVSGVVMAGTDPARYPLANQQPRLVSARVAVRSIIATIDSTLLDVLLTFDQSSTSRSVNAGVQADDDWLTRMFRSEAFLKLPPADIQRLLKQMESVRVREGEVVIRQGDEGDYFYIIRDGKCAVTRQASSEGWDVPLAELTNGDCFGEEALVSDAKRNATITMLTDGTLMRLSKQDFLELLKKPLVHYVDYPLAASMIGDGDLWLDVRLPDEFANQAFPGSLNIPLLNLRDQVDRLLHNRKYILCCDTGRRSASAAFLLSQRGFEVYVLEGGLNKGVPPEVFGLGTAPPAPEPAGLTGQDSATAPAGPAEPAAAQQQSAALQDALDSLQGRYDRYRAKAERLEAACREAQQARTELETALAQLRDRFARPLALK